MFSDLTKATELICDKQNHSSNSASLAHTLRVFLLYTNPKSVTKLIRLFFITFNF